ncbi:hypothetical protein NE865_09586 [Phthorimaea operculella]|nr:hypothetical protein NE865_09586 [Phthorimaea operculella]
MVVLLAVLTILSDNQLISAEDIIKPFITTTNGIPAHCQQTPGKVQVDDCCQILPVFDESSYLECGFKSFNESDPSLKIPRNASDPNCAKYFCVLEKNSIVENGTIVYDNLSNFLEEYGKEHPELKDIVHYAKLACTENILSFTEGNICNATVVTACLMATFFAECPGWDKSNDCQNLFNHMSQCNMHFMKIMINKDNEKIKNMNLVKLGAN